MRRLPCPEGRMLQDLQCYPCACLGIGQRMVMVPKVESAGGSDGLELMVGEGPAEMPSRSGERITEFIIWVVHPIETERRLQAALVKAAVVSDQQQALDEGNDPLPNLREDRGILSIFRSQAVHLGAEPPVVFRFGTDQAVERLGDFPSPDDDHPDAAYA